MSADALLAELKRVSAAQVKALRKAAGLERLALVDAGRLADLEGLVSALADVMQTAKMTRDYVQTEEFGYSGKKYLLDRDGFNRVLAILDRLKRNVPKPMGSAVPG